MDESGVVTADGNKRKRNWKKMRERVLSSCSSRSSSLFSRARASSLSSISVATSSSRGSGSVLFPFSRSRFTACPSTSSSFSTLPLLYRVPFSALYDALLWESCTVICALWELSFHSLSKHRRDNSSNFPHAALAYSPHSVVYSPLLVRRSADMALCPTCTSWCQHFSQCEKMAMSLPAKLHSAADIFHTSSASTSASRIFFHAPSVCATLCHHVSLEHETERAVKMMHIGLSELPLPVLCTALHILKGCKKVLLLSPFCFPFLSSSSLVNAAALSSSSSSCSSHCEADVFSSLLIRFIQHVATVHTDWCHTVAIGLSRWILEDRGRKESSSLRTEEEWLKPATSMHLCSSLSSASAPPPPTELLSHSVVPSSVYNDFVYQHGGVGEPPHLCPERRGAAEPVRTSALPSVNAPSQVHPSSLPRPLPLVNVIPFLHLLYPFLCLSLGEPPSFSCFSSSVSVPTSGDGVVAPFHGRLRGDTGNAEGPHNSSLPTPTHVWCWSILPALVLEILWEHHAVVWSQSRCRQACWLQWRRKKGLKLLRRLAQGLQEEENVHTRRKRGERRPTPVSISSLIKAGEDNTLSTYFSSPSPASNRCFSSSPCLHKRASRKKKTEVSPPFPSIIPVYSTPYSVEFTQRPVLSPSCSSPSFSIAYETQEVEEGIGLPSTRTSSTTATTLTELLQPVEHLSSTEGKRWDAVAADGKTVGVKFQEREKKGKEQQKIKQKEHRYEREKRRRRRVAKFMEKMSKGKMQQKEPKRGVAVPFSEELKSQKANCSSSSRTSDVRKTEVQAVNEDEVSDSPSASPSIPSSSRNTVVFRKGENKREPFVAHEEGDPDSESLPEERQRHGLRKKTKDIVQQEEGRSVGVPVSCSNDVAPYEDKMKEALAELARTMEEVQRLTRLQECFRQWRRWSSVIHTQHTECWHRAQQYDSYMVCRRLFAHWIAVKHRREHQLLEQSMMAEFQRTQKRNWSASLFYKWREKQYERSWIRNYWLRPLLKRWRMALRWRWWAKAKANAVEPSPFRSLPWTSSYETAPVPQEGGENPPRRSFRQRIRDSKEDNPTYGSSTTFMKGKKEEKAMKGVPLHGRPVGISLPFPLVLRELFHVWKKRFHQRVADRLYNLLLLSKVARVFVRVGRLCGEVHKWRSVRDQYTRQRYWKVWRRALGARRMAHAANEQYRCHQLRDVWRVWRERWEKRRKGKEHEEWILWNAMIALPVTGRNRMTTFTGCAEETISPAHMSCPSFSSTSSSLSPIPVHVPSYCSLAPENRFMLQCSWRRWWRRYAEKQKITLFQQRGLPHLFKHWKQRLQIVQCHERQQLWNAAAFCQVHCLRRCWNRWKYLQRERVNQKQAMHLHAVITRADQFYIAAILTHCFFTWLFRKMYREQRKQFLRRRRMSQFFMGEGNTVTFPYRNVFSSLKEKVGLERVGKQNLFSMLLKNQTTSAMEEKSISKAENDVPRSEANHCPRKNLYTSFATKDTAAATLSPSWRRTIATRCFVTSFPLLRQGVPPILPSCAITLPPPLHYPVTQNKEVRLREQLASYYTFKDPLLLASSGSPKHRLTASASRGAALNKQSVLPNSSSACVVSVSTAVPQTMTLNSSFSPATDNQNKEHKKEEKEKRGFGEEKEHSRRKRVYYFSSSKKDYESAFDSLSEWNTPKRSENEVHAGTSIGALAGLVQTPPASHFSRHLSFSPLSFEDSVS